MIRQPTMALRSTARTRNAAESGLRRIGTLPAAGLVGAVASVILHPRIEERVAEIDQQVHGQDDEREHHQARLDQRVVALGDRKSTRLNSSHYCATRMPY